MINKHELIENLLTGSINEILNRKKFKLKKSVNAFIRKQPYGSDAINFAFYDYGNLKQEFQINLGIRYEDIETEIEEFLHTMPKYRGMSFTLFAHIQDIYSGRLEKFVIKSSVLDVFEVHDKNDLNIIKGEIEEKLLPVIIKHFDEFNSLNKVHQRLNVENKNLYAPLHTLGIRRLLIALKVEKSACKDVHSSNLSMMSNLNDYDKNTYFSFVKHFEKKYSFSFS